jgi:NADPH:quinone reductase-like Zn-dependent oxidoreductase
MPGANRSDLLLHATESSLRAIIYDHYGPADILRVGELPEPALRAGCARVRVHACALNPKDVLIRKGKMRWLTPGGFPRCSGYDIAGVLLDDAGGLRAGEPVYGMIQDNQGRGCAEVVSLPYGQLARKPERLDFIQAAATPLAALTALQAMRDRLRLSHGDHILLNGASGGVGTFAIQIARAMELEVTAVCSSKNLELVRKLGAQHALPYDTVRIQDVRGLASIFDIYGNLGWSCARDMLTSEGTFCTTVPSPGAVARGILGRAGLHRAQLVVVRSNRADLDQLSAWVEADALTPLIDTTYAMEDAPQAHRHLETRRAQGKVVIQIIR